MPRHVQVQLAAHASAPVAAVPVPGQVDLHVPMAVRLAVFAQAEGAVQDQDAALFRLDRQPQVIQNIPDGKGHTVPIGYPHHAHLSSGGLHPACAMA